MKRLATLFGIVLLGSLVGGCGGGIPAGSPDGTPVQASDEFKNMMKTAGPKMQGKGEWVKKKKAAAAAPTPEATKSDP